MNEQLENVAKMIKKTFKTKSQDDCFEGCRVYIDAHCEVVKESYIVGIEEKFKAIDKKLDMIIGIVGVNGDNK